MKSGSGTRTTSTSTPSPIRARPTRRASTPSSRAFVSDYARFKILYEHGGLYFDTDVEVIRPLDDLIARGPFMGCERDGGGATAPSVAPGLGLGVNPGLGLGVNPGLGLGVNPGLPLYGELLALYAGLHFQRPDGSLDLKTVVEYTTELLRRHGLRDESGVQQVAGVWIYPQAYFCPVSVVDGKLRITPETRTIHHYAQSWLPAWRQWARRIVLAVGGARLKLFLKRVVLRK